MKFVLILYVCSMVNSECNQTIIPGYEFNSHIDCVYSGYGFAQKTFKNLEETEDLEKEYVEQEKLVIKFECKGLNVENT